VAATLAAAPTAPAIAELGRWKRELVSGRAALERAFAADPQPKRLLSRHAALVDRIVRGIWLEVGPPRGGSQVAVGGYGRGELFPHSDIDVLILLPRPLEPGAGTLSIERFIGMLWDAGLEVAHSVRTIEECETEMANDITIATSLLEHRLLAGSRPLYDRFRRRFAASLDVRSFFEAKALEQQQRHLRYQDTAYNLEPNVKESPGGLRDLQTIIWIARAAELGHSWRALATHGLMTASEAREVTRHERAIDDLRIRLHYLADRREDRLVFDVQTALARQLGLTDTPNRRASEQLMQRYYRAAKSVRQISVILMQNLHAQLFPAQLAVRPVDDDFQAVDELLDLRDDDLFVKRPSAILDSFLTLQMHPELKGMSAPLLRALCRVPPRSRKSRALHGDPAPAARRDPRAAAHESVRHPRALSAGVRPYRRPDATRSISCLHRR
jgi:[protein-PII] uridylyltransferase